MNLNKEQIKQAKSNLPENVVEILDSEETASLLIKIGKKHHLNIDQIGKMAIVVRLFIVGIIKPNDFNNTLTKETGLSTDVINLVTYELNQEILNKIRTAMKEATVQPKNTSAKPESLETSQPEKKEEISTADTFSQKTTSNYGLPREKVEVTDKSTATTPEKTTETPPRHDPYREPIT